MSSRRSGEDILHGGRDHLYPAGGHQAVTASANSGSWAMRALTASPTLWITASSSAFMITSSIQATSCSMSDSTMPRVVTAGVPTRMPEVTNGLRESNGTMFLLTVRQFVMLG